jgi:hypothetical protein
MLGLHDGARAAQRKGRAVAALKKIFVWKKMPQKIK